MKDILYRSLVCIGAASLFRRLKQRNKATIILYHDISCELFEQHLITLKKYYQIISLQDYFRYREAKQPFPEYTLIITFDDGYKGNYKLLPILERYQIPITIFLCSGIINTSRHYWFEEVKDSQPLKYIPERERLKRLKALSGFDRIQEYEDRQALNQYEIEQMKTWVDFQGHTEFHPCLPYCEAGDSKRELLQSAEVLRHQYGLNINTISYPNGDYTSRELEYCHGIYDYGVTVNIGVNDLHTEALQLKRIPIRDDDSVAKLQLKVSTFWYFIRCFFIK